MNYDVLKNAVRDVIKQNGNEEITGALLQQCLIAMISNLGQYYQFGGVLRPADEVTVGDVRMAYIAGPGAYSNIGSFSIENGHIGIFTYDTVWTLKKIDVMGGTMKFCGIAHPEDSPVYEDNRDLSYLASESGTYTDFGGIEIGIGEIAVLTYNDTADEWTKETLFDLKDYIAQTPGTSVTKTMSQKAITDAVSAISQFMRAGWYYGGVVFAESEPAAPFEGYPQKLFYIAVGPGPCPLEETFVLEDGEIGIVRYDWEANEFIDGQLIEIYATKAMLNTAITTLTAKIAEESAKKVNRNSIEQNLVAGSAMSLSGRTVIAEFLNRIVANNVGKGAAAIKSIHGKTLAWNQLIRNGNFANGTTDWIAWSATKSSISATNGVLTQTFTPDGGSAYEYGLVQESVMQVQSHVYMLMLDVKTPTIDANFYVEFGGRFVGAFQTTAGLKQRVTIKNTRAQYNEQLLIYPQNAPTESFAVEYSNIILVDLTLLGREDMTAQEFEALYPDAYYPYTPGTLISNDAESLETVGFNKWDEEWELGYIDVTTTGGNEPSNTRIRSKNYIPVFGNTTYFYMQGHGDVTPRLAYYDANKNFISGTNSLAIDEPFTTPANAAFIRFSTHDNYGTTYKHDICINISDPTRNGQYEPYKKIVVPFNIQTRTGKLNGQGASVVVFPDGTNGVGTSFDELRKQSATKRRARVNLGTLEWTMRDSPGIHFYSDGLTSFAADKDNVPIACSLYSMAPWLTIWTDTPNAPDKSIALSNNIDGIMRLVVKDTAYIDAASFKAAMDGVMLDYEIATPEEYVLDEPIADAYPVEPGGTETIVPGNTDVVNTAPFVAEIAYPINTERGLVSIGTLENLLSSLVSQAVINGYDLQFNANTGDYDVIIE